MFAIIRERLRQGYRTSGFPNKEPSLPQRFRGLPQAQCRPLQGRVRHLRWRLPPRCHGPHRPGADH